MMIVKSLKYLFTLFSCTKLCAQLLVLYYDIVLSYFIMYS